LLDSTLQLAGPGCTETFNAALKINICFKSWSHQTQEGKRHVVERKVLSQSCYQFCCDKNEKFFLYNETASIKALFIKNKFHLWNQKCWSIIAQNIPNVFVEKQTFFS